MSPFTTFMSNKIANEANEAKRIKCGLYTRNIVVS